MSENGLPKATMVNFIKDHISDKRKVSAEFTTLLLELSKQFIDKVSAHANEICEKEGKKTINNQHFFNALKDMGMEDYIKILEKTDQNLKIKQQKKQQDKQRVQQNIEKLNKRESQIMQQKQRQRMPIIESLSKYKPIQLVSEENYDQILELDQDEQEKN